MVKCKRCGELKEQVEFYKHNCNVTGYDYTCKECRAIERNERRRKHRSQSMTDVQRALLNIGQVRK